MDPGGGAAGGASLADDADASLYSGDGSMDLHVLDQEDEIRAAIAASQPLVGAKESFSSLQEQYADNPRFLYKLQTGSARYSHIRRVRGDGSCYYRSLLFAVLEFALLPPPSVSSARHFHLVSAFYAHFTAAPAAIITSGVYEELIVEDFYSSTLQLVDFATERTLQQQGRVALSDPEERAERSLLLAELLQRMNDADACMYSITWLRCLTSFQLQTHSDTYAPYLVEPYASVKAFCAAEVDGINREVDALQILALCTELHVAVHVEYMDGSEGPLCGYVIPEGKEPLVTLLYRPGHYDIIYRRDDEEKAVAAASGATAARDAAAAERKDATH